MHSIWVISDGAAGNRRQALALAAALGGAARELMLRPRAPWSWLAPRVAAGGLLAWGRRARAPLAPPVPGLGIGCGRPAGLGPRPPRGDRGGGGPRGAITPPPPRTAPRGVGVGP
ncbi:ELM1/GtrOC1 family putative glycosyltransferase, partial [Metallibacterium scheffleri]|uniref:ELM1/GtrOC1 family putative glycosyltransferase n=1 Tax=Metallibacterium scheffleri TaxID=993689 RepID=UPI001B3833A0